MSDQAAVAEAPAWPWVNEQQDWLRPWAFVHVVNSVSVAEHPLVLKRIILRVDPVRNVMGNVRHVQVYSLYCKSDWRSSKTGCLLASSRKSLSGASESTLKWGPKISSAKRFLRKGATASLRIGAASSGVSSTGKIWVLWKPRRIVACPATRRLRTQFTFPNVENK